MDRETKLRGLMGLCVRARQATFGEDGCLKSIRGGGCAVLLLDSGASGAAFYEEPLTLDLGAAG